MTGRGQGPGRPNWGSRAPPCMGCSEGAARPQQWLAVPVRTPVRTGVGRRQGRARWTEGAAWCALLCSWLRTTQLARVARCSSCVLSCPILQASLDQAGNITSASSAPRTRGAAKAYVGGANCLISLVEPRPYGTVTAVKTRSDAAAQQFACHLALMGICRSPRQRGTCLQASERMAVAVAAPRCRSGAS